MSGRIMSRPLQSSQEGIDIIITEEVSSEAYYKKHYIHFEFPGGASGPTVGIGFDCGWSTPQKIKEAWTGIISEDHVQALIRASGLKGETAHKFVREYRSSVTITWDQAMKEFTEHELPALEDQCRLSLKNYDLLPGDCAGAINSLVYNRGVGGFRAVSDRYREMRAIALFMGSKQFHLIPSQFISMRRLWPVGGGLWRRRGNEAALFQKGLTKFGQS